jgi:hypothetical protein
MEETVKIFTSVVTCICGQENAHILRGSVTNNDAEIYFFFECGHERRDIYHFHKGTTYCETQYLLKTRDWDFKIGTFDIWLSEDRQKAAQEDKARILAKVAAAEAKVVEANDGTSI